MYNWGSGTYGRKLLTLFMKHSWLNVTLVEVWTLEMLLFTHAFSFLFRVALPLSPIDSLGIELGNILNVLIIRGIGFLPRLAFLKSTERKKSQRGCKWRWEDKRGGCPFHKSLQNRASMLLLQIQNRLLFTRWVVILRVFHTIEPLPLRENLEISKGSMPSKYLCDRIWAQSWD